MNKCLPRSPVRQKLYLTDISLQKKLYSHAPLVTPHQTMYHPTTCKTDEIMFLYFIQKTSLTANVSACTHMHIKCIIYCTHLPLNACGEIKK